MGPACQCQIELRLNFEVARSNLDFYTEDVYDDMKQSIVCSVINLERIHQAAPKKLLQGAVEYAKNQGFQSLRL